MPISTRVQDIPYQLGLRAARARQPGQIIAWCPYDADSHDGQRWLEGWHSVTEEDPAPRPTLGRPPENQGQNEKLKAGSNPGLSLRPSGKAELGFLYRAANDVLPRAAKDRTRRERAPAVDWTESRVSWLRQLHGDGFTIDEIAGIMQASRNTIQKYGYKIGLSWRGRGPKG